MYWYKRFRTTTCVNAVIWLVWTVIIILPFQPFSYLQPIMAGGGAGTWFLLAYLLFVTVAVMGFAAISSFVFAIETHERRRLSARLMLSGIGLLYVGAVGGLILLGLAGAIGGYASVIAHSTVNATQNLLTPYVNLVTAASLVAVAGAGCVLYGMATAKKIEP